MIKAITVQHSSYLCETAMLKEAVLNKRRIILKKVLLQFMGLSISREQPILHLDDVEFAGLGEEFLKVSKALDLQASQVPQIASRLEIEVNGIAIALDDELHFNHFRLQTLQSPVYALPLIQNMDPYKVYCKQNPFPYAGRPAAVNLLKIEAINDFMQDLLPLVHFVPVLRLSIYDCLQTTNGPVILNQILLEENSNYFSLLADHILMRIESLEEVFNY